MLVEINTVSNGSTGSIMLNLAQIARRKNIDVKTFSMKWRNQSPPLEMHTYFGSFIENAISIRLGFLTGFNGCFCWIGTKLLLKNFDKIKPNIIHLHNLHNCYINLPMLFSYIKKHNIRVIWTLHDCWAFTGQCPHFTVAKCQKWKTGCHNCPSFQLYPKASYDNTKRMWQLKKKWFTGIEDLTIVTPSQWLADLVKKSYLKDYPVQVINNGIDLQVFKPTASDFRKKYGLKDKYIILGVAFGWGERKGLDVFVELSKRLDNSYQIVLVGTNGIVDKQLPDNIITIHRTQNQVELAEIYTAADLFVNPTREEVLGLVNIEANDCGTPVLTFRTGGSPECIDETCGFVVDCDDIDAMEREILRISKENPYTKAACIKRAKRFDMDDRFEEYVTLYNRL